MTGLTAKAVTRAYHLYALPLAANRVRVATDWLLAAVLPVQAVQLSGIRPSDALISSAEHTDIYSDPTTVRAAATDPPAGPGSAGAPGAGASNQPSTSSGPSGRAIR